MSQSTPTSFSSLPYELRSYIWSLAIDRRLIKNMRTERKRYPTVKERMEGADILYETSPSPPPAVVQVCHESRKHAPYERVFTRGTEPRWTWVNFEHDIFCITSVYNLADMTSHRSQVRRLKIMTTDDYDWQEAMAHFNPLRTLHEGFDGLREMQFVMEVGDLWWADAVGPMTSTFLECWPNANITFLDEGSGLMVTGWQLQLMFDWELYFSFDVDGNPPNADNLSEEIEFALQDRHLTLAQMYEID